MNKENTYSINSYLSVDKDKVFNALIACCISGDLEKVKFLLTNQELDCAHLLNMSDDDSYTCFMYAAEYDHLELLQYLLTSSELPHKADISHDYYETLRSACSSGNLEIVQAVCALEEFKNIAFSEVYRGLLVSISEDYENISQFLLHNYLQNELGTLAYDLINIGLVHDAVKYINFVENNISDKISKHDKINIVFKTAHQDNINFLQKIVFDFDIRYDSDFEKEIKKYKDNPDNDNTFLVSLIACVEKNELRHHLKDNLLANNTSNKNVNNKKKL